MSISQHMRFENYMDVSSPETIGDAQKVSDFFDENPYDDDFEAKLSEANKSIVPRENKVDITDSDGEKEKSDSLVRQEEASGENTDNLALTPTRPPLSETFVKSEEAVQKSSEYIVGRSSASTSETSIKHHPIQQTAEKIIATAAVVDAVGDIISGGVSAIAQPNRVRVGEVLPQTSIVSNESHHDIRSLDEAIEALGIEIYQSNDRNVKDVVTDLGQAIDSIGSDGDNQAEYVHENTRYDKSDDSADCPPLVESGGDNPPNPPNDGGGGDPPNPPDDGYIDSEIGLLRDKYSVIEQQPLNDADKASFLEGKYISAITNEDIKLYRIYGGGSTQDGSREGEHPKEYIYLTTEKPTDRMFEKMELALSNKWQGKRKDENGKPVHDKNGNPIVDLPNTREFFSEVIVPKGNIIYIGYVAPQNTKGEQELPGGGIQIMVQNKGLKFGKKQRLDFASNYAEFDEHAKKIERDT